MTPVSSSGVTAGAAEAVSNTAARELSASSFFGMGGTSIRIVMRRARPDPEVRA